MSARKRKGGEEEGPKWSCSACTYDNLPGVFR